jgi:hypothetical protein
MRTFLIGGLLAMAVGCGGPMEQDEEPNLASQESPIPNCANAQTSLTTYYDASYSTVIGERGCDCGAYISWGRTSVYREIRNEC